MSRAFTREIDDAPEAALPDRPISAARNLVTPRGAQLIRETVATLSANLEAAPPDGREPIRRELRYWSHREATMEIVPPVEKPREVAFGTAVTVRRGGKTQTMTIVGEDEAAPASGRLAWTSPLAAALIGAFPVKTRNFSGVGNRKQSPFSTLRRDSWPPNQGNRNNLTRS